MKIGPAQRFFPVEITEEDMDTLREILGKRSEVDAERDGVDYNIEFSIYSAICAALKG